MTARVIPVNFARRPPPAGTHFPEVSRLVRRAAVVLGQHTGEIVSTHVDADRCVGRARVQDTFFTLSIAVGVYSTLVRRPAGEDIHEWLDKKAAAPREVAIDIHADVEWLFDGTDATAGPFGGEYASVEVASVEAAAEWLQLHCWKRPVARVSSNELACWERKMVTVPEDKTKKTQISLGEAIKVYGRTYRGGISPELLVANHRIAVEDAKLIAAGVMKVLPKKRR